VFTGLYTTIDMSPYLYLWILPLIWVIVSRILFKDIEFHMDRNDENHTIYTQRV
jgi:hypothetical protein